MSDEPVQKKTSPWVYVGIGCLALIVLVVGGVVALGAWGAHAIKSFADEMKDPKVRQAKTQKLLGAEDLPDGYYAEMAMSLGFMDIAMLTDRAPDPKGITHGFDKHMFMYMRVPQSERDRQKLDNYMEGKTNDLGLSNNMSLSTKEIIRRGAFQLDGQDLKYVAQRGEFRNETTKQEGIQTTLIVDCPGDPKLHLGIWVGPDPDPRKPLKDLDLGGTTADEAAMKDFMAHFHVCKGA